MEGGDGGIKFGNPFSTYISIQNNEFYNNKEYEDISYWSSYKEENGQYNEIIPQASQHITIKDNRNINSL